MRQQPKRTTRDPILERVARENPGQFLYVIRFGPDPRPRRRRMPRPRPSPLRPAPQPAPVLIAQPLAITRRRLQRTRPAPALPQRVEA